MSEANDLTIARKFLDFMVDYYAMIRRHLVETNEFRMHSHGFSTLYALRSYRGRPITMTQFANEMGITKQQLTKLVNDLEERQYVVRSHNTENRRQVYVEITERGVQHLEKMLGEIVHEILTALSGFTDEEKRKIVACSETMSSLLRRDAERCLEHGTQSSAERK
ncbi:MAG: MarR family transcriptional regulator [Eubacteriales bacterium]